MIIGIAGHARHGKDTTADFIVKHFGYEKKVAFADPMRRAVLAAFPRWTWEHVSGPLKDIVDPVYGISPRHALQSIGDAWGRGDLLKYDNFESITGRGLWIRAALDSSNDKTIISDVRRVNEAEAIRGRGGIVIMIRRAGYPVDMSHPSESEVEEIRPDFVIRNGSTLEALEDETVKLMKEIFKSE